MEPVPSPTRSSARRSVRTVAVSGRARVSMWAPERARDWMLTVISSDTLGRFAPVYRKSAVLHRNDVAGHGGQRTQEGLFRIGRYTVAVERRHEVFDQRVEVVHG